MYGYKIILYIACTMQKCGILRNFLHTPSSSKTGHLSRPMHHYNRTLSETMQLLGLTIVVRCM